MPSTAESTRKAHAKRILRTAKVGDRIRTTASSARGAGLEGTVVGLAEPLDASPLIRVRYDHEVRTIGVLPTSIELI